MRPETSIQKIYQSLQARYKEHVIHHNISKGLLLKPVPLVDIGECHETWRRKETKFLAGKSNFYSSPHTVLVPQKKKKIEKDTRHLWFSNTSKKKEEQGTAHPCNIYTERPSRERSNINITYKKQLTQKSTMCSKIKRKKMYSSLCHCRSTCCGQIKQRRWL